jgi:hypothetical protein
MRMLPICPAPTQTKCKNAIATNGSASPYRPRCSAAPPSDLEGEPDGRRTRPEPPFLFAAAQRCVSYPRRSRHSAAKANTAALDS